MARKPFLFSSLDDDDDDIEVKEVKHAQFHAWLESYIEEHPARLGVIEVLTPKLHNSYIDWIGKNSLNTTYDTCNYQQFSYRLRCLFKGKGVNLQSSYVKGKGVVRTTIIDVNSVKDHLWE